MEGDATEPTYTDLLTAFLVCRTIGHNWDEFNPTDMRRASFGWRWSLRCTRCTTERHDLIDQNGNVAAREYRYPDAYKIAGQPARSDLRVEIKRRLMQEARQERRQRRALG